jgi:hypothetical protein
VQEERMNEQRDYRLSLLRINNPRLLTPIIARLDGSGIAATRNPTREFSYVPAWLERVVETPELL